MPNADAAFGFAPNVHVAGGTPARMNGYTIAADYATALYSGDVVRSAGNGRDIEIVPDGAGDRVLGVFAGCQYVDDAGDVKWLPYWPGIALADTNKVVECWVYDDPALEIIAQISTIDEASIGLLYGIDQTTNGGSAATGRSGAYVNQADTTNTKVRVIGLAENIGGIFPSEYGAFAKVRCQFVEHERNPVQALATAI